MFVSPVQVCSVVGVPPQCLYVFCLFFPLMRLETSAGGWNYERLNPGTGSGLGLHGCVCDKRWVWWHCVCALSMDPTSLQGSNLTALTSTWSYREQLITLSPVVPRSVLLTLSRTSANASFSLWYLRYLEFSLWTLVTLVWLVQVFLDQVVLPVVPKIHLWVIAPHSDQHSTQRKRQNS